MEPNWQPLYLCVGFAPRPNFGVNLEPLKPSAHLPKTGIQIASSADGHPSGRAVGRFALLIAAGFINLNQFIPGLNLEPDEWLSNENLVLHRLLGGWQPTGGGRHNGQKSRAGGIYTSTNSRAGTNGRRDKRAEACY